MSLDTDSSGISFTAFYTGEVWQRHGLSSPLLASSRGRMLYRALRPVELAASAVAGVNNEIHLLQRHRIIDAVVERAIREEGFSQVVELACGLSPRGLRFCQAFGSDIHYVEADLPGMAARKRKLLQDAGLLSAAHRVVACDILAEGGGDSLEALFAELEPGRKTLVITEGLINYFDYPTISRFWSRLALCLKAFPAGLYVTDLYPDLRWHRFVRTAAAFKAALALTTRSRVSLHFRTEADIRAGFRQAGFVSTTVHLPESWYGLLDIPVQRVPSIVRVLENRVAGGA